MNWNCLEKNDWLWQKKKNKRKCLALGIAEAQTNNCILFNSHLSGDFVCTVLKALLQCSATFKVKEY